MRLVFRSLVALRDLVLPAGCPGCGGREVRTEVCPGCAAELAACHARRATPEPAPPGLPACWAAGPYQGVLRELIVGYKERGRSRLAGLLGDQLGRAVAAGVPGPAVLVPVPATARAVRQRRGDHMLRLARRAALRLRAEGRHAVVLRALRARPRPDSTGLGAARRLQVARSSLTPRPGVTAALRRAGNPAVSGTPAVVVVDDVVTTGATVAAACEVLGSVGVDVQAGVVLAATQRRRRAGLRTDAAGTVSTCR